MIAVLSKPADQIGVSDLQALIDSEVPESDQIEFKETLSTRDGSPDRWITHRDGIGNRARDSILEEAVAFANAYGGALLLGIRESESRPPVVARIVPIPQCAELAERLKLVFRDCVEPQIPLIEIFAIPTAGDCGVVVIRTGHSRMAPHRVKPTRKCPIRRSDRCEEMTMREVQDLTLGLSRGLERLEQRLKARSRRFVEEFKRLENPNRAYGIRVTAAPVGNDIQFERVYGNDELIIPWQPLYWNRPDGKEELFFDCGTTNLSWQPMLRATRGDLVAQNTNIQGNVYQEIHCDGLLEVGDVQCVTSKYTDADFRYRNLIAVFGNLLVWTDLVRSRAFSPSSEYVIDVELHIRGDNIRLFEGERYFLDVREIKSGPPIRYPGYSLGESSEIPNLISLFERDFWDSIGSRFGGYEDEYIIRG